MIGICAQGRSINRKGSQKEGETVLASELPVEKGGRDQIIIDKGSTRRPGRVALALLGLPVQIGSKAWPRLQ